VPLFIVGVDAVKGILYSRLGNAERGAPGFCHFPSIPQFDDEYFRQLTAEKRVRRYRRGHGIDVWIQVRNRNEALDCRVYATAALYILRPSWDALHARVAPAKEEPEAPPPKKPQRKPHNRQKKSWVDAWRY
jgi:phage terminase large subunit GpA-like protein